MRLNLFFHALAMLCSLGAVAMATFAVRPRSLVALAFGFGAAALVVRPDALPDPAAVGGAIVAVAATALLRPRYADLIAASAGVLAAIWMSMLEAVGAPLIAAILIAVAPVICSAFFTRRDLKFAPLDLREEALLLVLVFAVVVALAPGVAAGWQSATALNLEQKEVGAQVVPAWTLLFTLGAAAAGGLYSVWMRR